MTNGDIVRRLSDVGLALLLSDDGVPNIDSDNMLKWIQGNPDRRMRRRFKEYGVKAWRCSEVFGDDQPCAIAHAHTLQEAESLIGCSDKCRKMTECSGVELVSEPEDLNHIGNATEKI